MNDYEAIFKRMSDVERRIWRDNGWGYPPYTSQVDRDRIEAEDRAMARAKHDAVHREIAGKLSVEESIFASVERVGRVR
jgi:hypothetical protein